MDKLPERFMRVRDWIENIEVGEVVYVSHFLVGDDGSIWLEREVSFYRKPQEWTCEIKVERLEDGWRIFIAESALLKRDLPVKEHPELIRMTDVVVVDLYDHIKERREIEKKIKLEEWNKKGWFDRLFSPRPR